MVPFALTTLTTAVSPATQPPLSVFGGSFVPTQVMDAAGPTAAGVAGPLVDGVSGAAAPTAPFADLVTEAVGQVNQLEQQARFAVEGLMSGTGVDVHEAMIATEKAEMGFELVLSVRNKALAAYQQVMGMQF